jgi:streptogramin lyase
MNKRIRPARLSGLAVLVMIFAGSSYASTISGTVKGADGAPFRGAFVQAQSQTTHITVNVLSDKDGNYKIADLPAGQYDVRISAVGYVSDPHTGMRLGANRNSSVDFTLRTSMVKWSDLSPYQASQLFPDNPAKKFLFDNTMCMQCHAFETRMAPFTLDKAGWRSRIEYMRHAMAFVLERKFNDQDADSLATYLASLFGPNSVLPKSPADMSQYKDLVQPYTEDSMKIVYVEYKLPKPSSMPFSAAPDDKGMVWIPENGVADRIARLNPKTGVFQEYTVPTQGTAEIHSAVEAPDGNVWLTEQAVNKLGKWDAKTHEITEYEDTTQAPNGRGSKHTLVIDKQGDIWATGGPSVSRFDPKTETFTHYDVKGSYGLVLDKDGNCWVGEFFSRTGKIAKIDAKTGKVTEYAQPTADGRPRRIEVDSQGIVWFAENGAGKIGRFDPTIQTFKEYQLPGARPSPMRLESTRMVQSGIRRNTWMCWGDWIQTQAR